MSEVTAVPSGFVLAGASSLRSDEKAFSLEEVNKLNPERNALHRVQLIIVVRNDRLTEFARDMGPATLYDGKPEFILFGLFEEEVAGLMEMADEERERTAVQTILEEIKENSTLVEDAVRLEEQKHTLRRRNKRTLREDS